MLSLALDVNPAWLQGFDVPQEFSGAESSIKEDISKNRYNRTGDDNSGKKTDTTQASATDFKNNNSADICKTIKHQIIIQITTHEIILTVITRQTILRKDMQK